MATVPFGVRKVLVVIIIVDSNNVVVVIVVGGLLIVAVALVGEFYEVTCGANGREAEKDEVVSASFDGGVSESTSLTLGGFTNLAAVFVHAVDGFRLAGQPQGDEAQEAATHVLTLGAANNEGHVIAVNGNRLGQVTVVQHASGLLTAVEKNGGNESERKNCLFHIRIAFFMTRNWVRGV